MTLSGSMPFFFVMTVILLIFVLKYQLAGRRQSLDDVRLDAAAILDFAAAVRVKDLSIRVCHLLTHPRSSEPLVEYV